MAITRYAGDRFTIAAGETKPTGVLDGAVLIDTGNLTPVSYTHLRAHET